MSHVCLLSRVSVPLAPLARSHLCALTGRAPLDCGGGAVDAQDDERRLPLVLHLLEVPHVRVTIVAAGDDAVGVRAPVDAAHLAVVLAQNPSLLPLAAILRPVGRVDPHLIRVRRECDEGAIGVPAVVGDGGQTDDRRDISHGGRLRRGAERGGEGGGRGATVRAVLWRRCQASRLHGAVSECVRASRVAGVGVCQSCAHCHAVHAPGARAETTVCSRHDERATRTSTPLPVHPPIPHSLACPVSVSPRVAPSECSWGRAQVGRGRVATRGDLTGTVTGRMLSAEEEGGRRRKEKIRYKNMSKKD